MAMSKSAERAYKKAVKAKKKAKRGHWLLIQKDDSVKEVFSKLFTQFAVLVLIGCGVILANEFRLSFSARQLNDSLKSSAIPDTAFQLILIFNRSIDKADR